MSNLLLSYYGDDFTGSTDVMEALASNGVETVLFLGIPSEVMLERFKDCRAIGIAGTSRSETPQWMDEHLTPAFTWLRGLDAAICHYKVCSTFDSSPRVGNIGKAIEVGKAVFAQSVVPVVVGAPQLKRYTAFGHLFAAYQGQVFRIDRHPVMSRHPVTPMDEADLTLHMSKQTSLLVSLVDLIAIRAADADRRIDALAAEKAGILLLDVDSSETQAAAGRQLWRLANKGNAFMAGSSGVEYALLNAWRNEGLIGGKPEFAPPGKVDRLAVVSGSVSPTTERQIRRATAEGFDGIDLDPLQLVGENAERALEKAVHAGIASLKAGRSVILHTALGPSADRGGDIDRIPDARHRLGQALGTILRRLIEQENLGRAVIAGGDTSSHALKELRVEALTTLLPLPQTPGSPLCTAHGSYTPTNGLQIALKGGQVGTDDYFAQIRDGRGS
ncbi:MULTISPECIES: four-carbon acid sugar kinase family protein [unclassified Rhizobium]|uniref:four-carbon acid sugar kinase family protein n=1 Tax=unclassified Rhizobium TaxID=2613769 RepID=UPI000EA926A2|nr:MULTISPECIES: four-carbon acid sugar kinase family protein [unclassified Rhizobium]AYG69594.1 four-carbon acid sugar kinase family protein [Rhizobium sp. CCGE531]AYG75973.1 four-carbon acid sugar kinase family protein [Rhizobium sp. CCGE532]